MARIRGITDEMILNKYAEGLSIAELATFAGVSSRAIRNVFYKSGTNNIQRPRKHKVNEDFFDVWTKEMAWVLGLFVTDGFLINNSLQFTQKDERILRLIANYMEADYILIKPSTTKRTPTLSINSKKLAESLSGFGILTKKSLNVPFPEVPEAFLPHFIRGVIDGDGWVQDRGYTMNVTSGSINFAIQLKKVFSKWNLNSYVRHDKTPLNRDIYRIFVSGKYDIPRLAEIIYQDCGEAFVHQKRERMSQRYFEIPENKQLNIFEMDYFCD